MKHINHFNQFLIKESFTSNEDIKELIEGRSIWQKLLLE